MKKDYDQAIKYFEKGVAVQPDFPSNYYWCAKIYCGSTEKMWGMIYGELFMNIERNSSRTAEISKLLYDTYKSQIVFKSATETTVSFSKQNVITNPKQLPYSIIYEPTMGVSLVGENNIDINSLSRIRKRFTEFYFKKGFNKKYPNVLFDYQDNLIKAGQMDAYNHWLLMKGDEEGFNAWKDSNNDAWNSFIKWFTNNGLQLDANNRFYRVQYDL
jgi:effector-binding domain-containing protein